MRRLPSFLLLWTWFLLSLAPGANAQASRLQKRWLFFWQDMQDQNQVDAMMNRFPQAHAAGYNGVVFPCNIASNKAAALQTAARQNSLDLIAIVMGNIPDRNDVEGVPVTNALFVVHDGRATLQQDNPTKVLNGDFEDVAGNHFHGWTMQDDEGVTSFADHEVVHGGKTSLRMENIRKNEANHCRLAQPIKLQPGRQYHISVWVKTDAFSPADAEVKVLSPDAAQEVCFQTFHLDSTQGWKQCNLVFNSLDYDKANLYVGSWDGRDGKIWWDDLRVEEIGLVNVLRRPGCPVTVRGDSGDLFEEGRDYQRIADPILNPWSAWHDEPPIRLTSNSRIHEGDRLRVSYYHPIVVYEDRVNACLSEPAVFDAWAAEVRRANDLYHPAAFFMSHDEIRVANQCALCRSRNLTAGELLAANVKQCAAIIRQIRPDAEIWVWSDMFDPMHNAVDHYYCVRGSLAGSWKGLDKDVGIVNWNGGAKGKDCPFFANLGLRQILSGYYDSDDDGSAIAEWLVNTTNVPNIVGAMYTTWENKYQPMTSWAKKAWPAEAAP